VVAPTEDVIARLDRRELIDLLDIEIPSKKKRVKS